MRLRRQLYALEEASVLGSDTPQRTDATAAGAGGPNPGTGPVAAAGPSNPLDVSWLNSRKDTVGKDKEAELWAAAREFVVDLDQKSADDSQTTGDSEKMQVD